MPDNLVAMNAENELILSMLHQLTAEAKYEPTASFCGQKQINWDKIKLLLLEHGIAPFVYPILDHFASLVHQELNEFLKSNYYLNLTQNLILHREFIRIASAFNKMNISVVPIKGIAFLQDIYAKSPIRPMVDMDLFVKEDELAQAQGVLEKCGYEKNLEGLLESYWRNNQCHIAFCKVATNKPKNIHIDLHWGLDFKRKKRAILPQLWKHIRKVKVDNLQITLLSPEDNFFSLALHQRRFGKIINLKYALDTALILRNCRNFNWDYVVYESRRGKMCSCVFFMLAQTEYFLGINIPDPVKHGLGVSSFKQKVIRDFIAKNAFKFSNVNSLKKIYLGSHFLLYDSLMEPVEYILNIPKEQFAKFYNLKPYDKQTQFYYNNRLLYMPFKLIKRAFGK